MIRRRATLFLAVAALAVAGCGGDDDGGGEDKLDTGSIQERLTAELEDQPTTSTAEPLEVTSMECPDEVDKKKGTEFECDVETADGLTGTVEVELDDDEGEAVTYEAELQGENRSVGKSGSLEPESEPASP